MSDTLERVIAEQQQEIDRLRAAQFRSLEANRRLFDQQQALFDAVAPVLDFPHRDSWRDEHIDSWQQFHAHLHRARSALTDAGFCMHCYAMPCECQPEDF